MEASVSDPQPTEAEVSPDLRNIKIEIIRADGVWMLEQDEQKSSAVVCIKFPGGHPDCLFESNPVPPIIPPPPEPTVQEIEEKIKADEEAKAKAEADAVKGKGKGKEATPKSGKGKKGKEAEEPLMPLSPANFAMGICKEFSRISHWPFWHLLTQEALVVTILWVSPSGVRAPVGICKVDLSGLLTLNTGQLRLSAHLEVPKEEDPAEKKPGKGKAQVPAKKEAKVRKGAAQEVTPPLLDGAFIEVALSVDKPLLSEVDRSEGVMLDVSDFFVTPLPSKLVEIYQVPTPKDPFNYGLSLYLPGFTGPWWESMIEIEDNQKQQISLAKSYAGIVQVNEQTSRIDNDGNQSETMKISQQGVGSQDTVEAIEPGTNEVPGPFLTWNISCRRFLPSFAVEELKKRIRRGVKIYGEIARFIKDERPDLTDPCFNNYHCRFWMDLRNLVQEGVTETTLCCLLEDPSTGEHDCPHLLQPLDRTVNAKAVPVEPADPTMQNVWHTSRSTITIKIKLSGPLEPVWIPPPEPKMKLSQVVPPRPKVKTVYDAGKEALEDFKGFIKEAAKEIGEFLGSLTIEDEDKSKSVINRVEHTENMRQKLTYELRKIGAWKELRDTMTKKILKFGSTKFKLKKEEALALGKFEFCNALYTELMEEIQNSINEVTKQENEKAMIEVVQTPDSLKELALEYELDGDVRSANKFFLERLVGDGSCNSQFWFEYGAFLMRKQVKDHGRAEECFREAISRDRHHIMSLRALAALCWHRGFLVEAEVLLQSAIGAHPNDEFILWTLLSQVYGAQDDRTQYLGCLRKAALLYEESSSSFQVPQHDFPFNISAFVYKGNMVQSYIVPTAVVLLDLHLPMEANEVLKLEDELLLSKTEYKMCVARYHELLSDNVGAERVFEEALSLSYYDIRIWLMMANLRFHHGQFQEALKAFIKVIQFLKDDKPDMYTFLELGRCYLNLGDHENAKQTFLKGCSGKQCSSMWLGAGISFYRLGDMLHAETALIEGNLLDNQNFKIWGYLSLVCLSGERMEEAEFAFQQAIKSFGDASLLAEIGVAFESRGNFKFAEVAFSKSLEEEDNVEVRFKLADIFHREGNMAACVAQYEKIHACTQLSEDQQVMLALKKVEFLID